MMSTSSIHSFKRHRPRCFPWSSFVILSLLLRIHGLIQPLRRNRKGSFQCAVQKDHCRRRIIPTFLHANSDGAETNSNVDSKENRIAQQTPHSGRHFLPSHPSYTKLNGRTKRISKLRTLGSKILNRNPLRRPPERVMHKRFMEGWYYRLTLPEEKVSFAFIFSIEDPNPTKNEGELALAAVQVMGPDDEYVVQADKDHSKFWAWEHSQAFGYSFEMEQEHGTEINIKSGAMTPEEFRKHVKSGFQVLPTYLQGKVDGHDGSLGGVLEGQGLPRNCEFDMEIKALSGWGDDGKRQKATAGWLASFSVFEPHWQITMADGRATGSATWNGKRYDFEDAPFYQEKNWGGSFPEKWYWVQCNSFEGYTSKDGSSRLSLTAGGGIRKVLGGKEDLGMVCVHHNGVFYEAVPWTGNMEWDVSPWGSWKFNARCTSGKRLFEVEVEATCKEDGVVLRAPTKDLGLAYFCRDSFLGNCYVSLYTLIWDAEKKDYVRGEVVIDNVKSIDETCAVEIGGGPYWNNWRGVARMKKPLKALVKLPYLLQRN